MNRKVIAIAAILVVLGAVIVAVGYPMLFPAPYERLIIATTTSTVDSGLLDYLKPYFDNKVHANMTWLYLGTGAAITAAARGDADILLVHDRVRENAFVASGNGTRRVTIMSNDFVVVGPANDPANINGLTNATEAFRRIGEAGSANLTTFVSRGDKSGTNSAELRLWAKAGITSSPLISPNASWYWSAGQGMAPTIRIANEKQGYTLADRSSWITLKEEMGADLSLELLAENESNPSFVNPYGLILLNSTRYPDINSELAEKFFLFMISDEGQYLIGNFTGGGEKLFLPLFGRPELIGLPSEQSEVDYWKQQLADSNMSPPSWVSNLIVSVIYPSDE